MAPEAEELRRQVLRLLELGDSTSDAKARDAYLCLALLHQDLALEARDRQKGVRLTR